MTLIPLPSRVYLRRTDPPTTSTASPFALPDAAREKPVEAIVVAVPDGPSYEYGILVPCPVQVGQRVLIGKYAGDYDFRGGKVTIVRFDEILAVIHEDDANEQTLGNPSAADLDAVAAEQDIASQTKGTAA